MTGIPPIAAYPLPSADELPANTARWRLDPLRAVLLVHDMQRYFLDPFPAGPRRELVARAALLRTRCAARGVQVAYTAQPGSMSRQERGLLQDFWGPGMRATPEDREVVPALAPEDGDWVLVKRRYSAFFRSGLLGQMRAAGRDQLVLCGVYAHVGVLATAVEAFTHDIRVFLVADAVADFSREDHDTALRYAAGRCAVVVTTEEVLS
ncbi:isochorismate hydrolase [Streptomyces sp. PanSC19]|uniref:isochorismatase family protein n=1 Tax=Streptomyces sp. PanSC19 TaxID=1520455 RepID=UPI000F462B60|nr:isochorismatase family protein [Streptomyces sp. PanSC19]ROQ35927.1 isochorismate hydrolase [Streptomyces sp. PanSC19]